MSAKDEQMSEGNFLHLRERKRNYEIHCNYGGGVMPVLVFVLLQNNRGNYRIKKHQIRVV